MFDLYKEPYKNFPKFHSLELRGAEGTTVELINGPLSPYRDIFIAQQASWRPWETKELDTKKLVETLQSIADGKIWAGQAFEGSSFSFAIKNISRSCTHQIVRTRIGAGFMQESGREGAWHKAPFIVPLTILERDKAHKEFIQVYTSAIDLYKTMTGYDKKDSYSELRDKNIPIQDARNIVPHAVAQNVWATYNYQSLFSVMQNRLCCTMQWEINTVMRMMRDELTRFFPLLGSMLKSRCETSGGHCVSKTPYYEPGAKGNGNKVYHAYEGDNCGHARTFDEVELKTMIDAEREMTNNYLHTIIPFFDYSKLLKD